MVCDYIIQPTKLLWSSQITPWCATIPYFTKLLGNTVSKRYPAKSLAFVSQNHHKYCIKKTTSHCTACLICQYSHFNGRSVIDSIYWCWFRKTMSWTLACCGTYTHCFDKYVIKQICHGSWISTFSSRLKGKLSFGTPLVEFYGLFRHPTN